MIFDYTLVLHRAFYQTDQKMTIFLKLKKMSKKIIFFHQKQIFLILDINWRLWVNFYQKIWIRYRSTSILVKSANFGTFCILVCKKSQKTMVPNDTIFCQNVLNKSPDTVTERYFENLFFLGLKLNFEFLAFFWAFTRCSKTNKIMSYLKINKKFGFWMVDFV
jgi:hypothetical protein